LRAHEGQDAAAGIDALTDPMAVVAADDDGIAAIVEAADDPAVVPHDGDRADRGRDVRLAVPRDSAVIDAAGAGEVAQERRASVRSALSIRSAGDPRR
jgi:hypothetical protein